MITEQPVRGSGQHGERRFGEADAVEHFDAVGFVGASSLERMAVEESLTQLTREFKAIPLHRTK